MKYKPKGCVIQERIDHYVRRVRMIMAVVTTLLQSNHQVKVDIVSDIPTYHPTMCYTRGRRPHGELPMKETTTQVFFPPMRFPLS